MTKCYRAVEEVEIEFELGSDSPAYIIVEEGTTFKVQSHERRGEEWDVLSYDGEHYEHPCWRSIRSAVSRGDLVEV